MADERWVPPRHDESNERAVREALLSKVSLPPDQIHPMFREGTPQEGAEAYEREIQALLGDEPLDLVLLGMGADGHTASLFPGDPSTQETTRLVLASRASAGIPDRLTLTPPLLCAARELLFLVTGADKAEALRDALQAENDPINRPAGHIARCSRRAVWLTDALAAQRL